MTNRFQSLSDVQREHFLSDATKSHDWRIDQLDRMERMLTDNRQAFCAALYQDFGKPPFEQLFEITVPSGVIKYYRENLKTLMAPRGDKAPAFSLQGRRALACFQCGHRPFRRRGGCRCCSGGDAITSTRGNGGKCTCLTKEMCSSDED